LSPSDTPPDETYDPNPGQPLDPATFDPDRFRGLIELGLATHPDRLRVDRFLRAGAEFTATPVDDGNVLITLTFTERSPTLAAIRADVSGGEIGLLDASEYGEHVRVIQAPLSALRKVNQG
jgi:hypothetical protein